MTKLLLHSNPYIKRQINSKHSAGKKKKSRMFLKSTVTEEQSLKDGLNLKP